MLQRQDSLLSSSHRQTPPQPENHHAKAIGCMSGFFKLFSKYQNRNKRLTFGKKHAKSTSVEAKAMVQKLEFEVEKQQEKDSSSVVKEDIPNSDTNNGQNLEQNILSTRSPVLSPEIRRSNALTTQEKTTIPRPVLVARLMGLEQPCEVIKQEKSSCDSTEKKRRNLLEALQKCNEDLEALKKVIVAVQSDQKKCLKPPTLRLKDEDQNLAKTCLKRNAEQLMMMMKPVSALEEISRCCNTTRSNFNEMMAHRNKSNLSKNPREDDSIGICYINKINTAAVKERREVTNSRFWSSKAMIQSVDEVCNHISWGEKREMGNIGMVLQNHICRDLIEEALYDLGFSKVHELPFEKCKRQLSF